MTFSTTVKADKRLEIQRFLGQHDGYAFGEVEIYEHLANRAELALIDLRELLAEMVASGEIQQDGSGKFYCAHDPKRDGPKKDPPAPPAAHLVNPPKGKK